VPYQAAVHSGRQATARPTAVERARSAGLNLFQIFLISVSDFSTITNPNNRCGSHEDIGEEATDDSKGDGWFSSMGSVDEKSIPVTFWFFR
jgi:hypothetical protein